MKNRRMRLFGRVQGVNFRASAQDYARSIGATGFVRNEPDGTVLLEAEGDEDTLEQLMEWSRRGPTAARVEDIEAEDGPVKHYSDFEIKG